MTVVLGEMNVARAKAKPRPRGTHPSRRRRPPMSGGQPEAASVEILEKMEGAVQSASPRQAVNGDRGQLAMEDRTKAEAFITCYANVSKNVRLLHRDRETKAEIKEARAQGCCCAGQKTEVCQPFSEEELTAQLKKMHLRKAPGPDEICTEHLVHLDPKAQEVVLRLINRSWESAVVPSSWRRATIIPIPKAGKDPGSVGNYWPPREAVGEDDRGETDLRDGPQESDPSRAGRFQAGT